MSPAATLCFLLGFVAVFSATANDYRGKVGKMEAVFSLDWKEDATVSGSYSYPQRPGVIYRLSGNNFTEGRLYLEEFTNGQLSARCYLQKALSDSEIIWRGEMKNTDGRTLEMRFSRSRGNNPPPPSTAPLAPPRSISSDAQHNYTGHVGKLAADYTLTWYADSSISGSYSYPDRPGTAYRLAGRNPREGEIYLIESTGDQVTARCNLRKRLTEDRIIWEGEMKNTDGRSFPIVMSRARNALPVSPPADKHEENRDSLLSKIPRVVSWKTFPKASQIVERVPLSIEGAEYFVGMVKEYTSSASEIQMTFDVGDWGNGDEVIYNGPTVRFKMARTLPIPAKEIVGQTIGIQIDPSGSLIDIELYGFAISHYRKSNGEKLEVKGVLETDELAELYDVDNAKIREIISRTPKIAFIPDKMALGNDPAEDVFFRSIRLTPDYGIVIQATAAGPGMLELETLSLDAPTPENPWIFIGDPAQRLQVPLSQQTGEAG